MFLWLEYGWSTTEGTKKELVTWRLTHSYTLFCYFTQREISHIQDIRICPVENIKKDSRINRPPQVEGLIEGYVHQHAKISRGSTFTKASVCPCIVGGKCILNVSPGSFALNSLFFSRRKNTRAFSPRRRPYTSHLWKDRQGLMGKAVLYTAVLKKPPTPLPPQIPVSVTLPNPLL